jgi:hypothetical protein
VGLFDWTPWSKRRQQQEEAALQERHRIELERELREKYKLPPNQTLTVTEYDPSTQRLTVEVNRYPKARKTSPAQES